VELHYGLAGGGEHTAREVGAVLGVNLNLAESLIRRGLVTLRKLWDSITPARQSEVSDARHTFAPESH
jgi:hypothetical protein